jgi:hypothetical protein
VGNLVGDRDGKARSGFRLTSYWYVFDDTGDYADGRYLTDRHDGAGDGNNLAHVNYRVNPDNYDPKVDNHDDEPRYGGRRLLSLGEDDRL